MSIDLCEGGDNDLASSIGRWVSLSGAGVGRVYMMGVA